MSAMTTRPTFRQTDILRAVRGVLKAGEKVTRVEIDREGKIVIHCLEDAPAPEESPEDALARLARAKGWVG